MVLLLIGLVLFVLGVLGFCLSYFGSSIDYAHRSAEILNWDVQAGTVALWGFVSALLLVTGGWFLKKGLAIWRRQRKEAKQLEKAQAKALKAEAAHETPPSDVDA